MKRAAAPNALIDVEPASSRPAPTLVTPLGHWSDLNDEVAELHIAVGKAYATAADSEPYPSVVEDIRARFRRCVELLRAVTPRDQ